MTAFLAITGMLLAAMAADAGNAGMCPKVFGRASYDTAWLKILSERRIAVEAAIYHLEQQRQSLENSGDAPGSGQDVAKALFLGAGETKRVVQDVIELVHKGPVGVIVSEAKKAAAGALQKSIDDPETKAFDMISLAIGQTVDNLKNKIPGLQLTKEMDDIIAAHNKYRKQLAAITRDLNALKLTLQNLGGPERKYSIDALLESARAEQTACVASTKLAPLRKPDAQTDQTAVAEAEPQANNSPKSRARQQYPSTAPVAAGCAILGTCNK